MIPAVEASLPRSIRKYKEQLYRTEDQVQKIKELQYQNFRAQHIEKLPQPRPLIDKYQVRLSKLQIEERNRAKIRQLFQQDLNLYQEILQNSVLSESQKLQAQELKLQPFREQMMRKKEKFNQEMYEKQFNSNCDEIRYQQHQIKEHANKLSLDYQVNFKKQLIQKQCEDEKRIDQLAIDDFQLYQEEKKQDIMAKRIRVKQQQKEMEEQMTEQEVLRAASEAQLLIEKQKEQELTSKNKLILQLEKDVALQRKLANRLFLETQIAVEKAKRQQLYDKQIKEEKGDINKIIDEIRADAIKQLKQKELLRDEQACYVLLLEHRQQIIDKENATLDRIYHNQIVEGAQREQQREREEAKLRQQIQGNCYLHNKKQESEQKLTKAANREQQVQREKAEWIESKHQLEEENLIRMQKQLDQQREWVEFLKQQKQQQLDRQTEEMQREAQLIKYQQMHQDKINHNIRQLLTEQQDQLSEIKKCFWSEPANVRPKLKQMQWYNH